MTPLRMSSVACLLAGVFSLQAHASTCAEDMAAVDKALKQQYSADRTHWWDAMACAILMDTQLRKDAVVTQAQVKDISYWRNVAYMQHARGDDKLCVETLKTPKRMLHLP
jgi:hypothetical protein